MRTALVAIRRPDFLNDIKTKDELEGLSVDDILKMLNITDAGLSICTPSFQKLLRGSEIPLKSYPDLVNDKKIDQYSLVGTHLKIVPSDKLDVEVLKVEINASAKDISKMKLSGQDQPSDAPQEPSYIKVEGITPYWAEVTKDRSVLENLEEIEKQYTMAHSNSHLTYGNGEEIDVNVSFEEFVEKARSLSLTLTCIITEKMRIMVSNRSNTLQEIRTTEETYISGLKKIDSFWFPALMKTNFLTPADAELFTHFRILYSSQEMFLDKVISRGTDFGAILSDVFIGCIQIFKVSSYVIAAYKPTLNAITTRLKQPGMKEVMDSINESNTEPPTLPITSLLITPVQRMPRYVLLIRTLLDFTPKCHPDYNNLLIASERVARATKEMEIRVEETEAIAAQQEITNRLVVPHIIIKAGRVFVMQAEITLFKPHNSTGMIYVFSDVVMVSVHEKNKMERIIAEIPLAIFNFFIGIQSLDNISIVCESIENKLLSIFFKFNEQSQKSEFLKKIYTLIPSPASDNEIVYRNVNLSVPSQFLAQHAGAYINDRAYYFGGMVAEDTYSHSVISFNKEDGSIDILDSKLSPRAGLTATVWGNRVLLFGGISSKRYLSDVLIYSPKEDKFETLQTTGECVPRAFHTADIVDDMLIVFGGENEEGSLNSTSILNLKTLVWYTGVFMGAPSPRVDTASVVFNDKIVYIGGANGDNIFHDFHVFDVSSIRWIRRNFECRGLEPRAGHHAFRFGNNILLVGGRNKSRLQPSPVVIRIKTSDTKKIETSGVSMTPIIRDSILYDGKSTFVSYGGTNPEQSFIHGEIRTFNLPSDLQNLPEITETPQELTPVKCKLVFQEWSPPVQVRRQEPRLEPVEQPNETPEVHDIVAPPKSTAEPAKVTQSLPPKDVLAKPSAAITKTSVESAKVIQSLPPKNVPVKHSVSPTKRLQQPEPEKRMTLDAATAETMSNEIMERKKELRAVQPPKKVESSVQKPSPPLENETAEQRFLRENNLDVSGINQAQMILINRKIKKIMAIQEENRAHTMKQDQAKSIFITVKEGDVVRVATAEKPTLDSISSATKASSSELMVRTSNGNVPLSEDTIMDNIRTISNVLSVIRLQRN